MDYIGTNSQGTANAPNGMSDQLLGTWFQPGFPFLGARHCAILPWPHVRNQQKRFPREHFTFARQEKRFAREHFTFARQEKRFARERFAFARQEKRFPRKHFAFARQEKRFPREHSAFAREESDFLVADELASFSDDLSTLRRTEPGQARGSVPGSLQKQQLF